MGRSLAESSRPLLQPPVGVKFVNTKRKTNHLPPESLFANERDGHHSSKPVGVDVVTAGRDEGLTIFQNLGRITKGRALWHTDTYEHRHHAPSDARLVLLINALGGGAAAH